jgi:nucleoid DNA-binding protein
MTTVTKRDLVHEVSKKHNLSQQRTAEIVNTFIGCIAETLAEGKDVTLRKFGTFSLVVAKAKKGRNPNVPDVEISIPERATLKFKPSEELKESVEKLEVGAIKDRPKGGIQDDS